MKTKKEFLAELKASKSAYITYGESELGIPVKREAAIADIKGMDDEVLGEGTWYECNKKGLIK